MRTNFDDLLRDKVNSLDNFIPPEVQWEPENSWIRISRVLGKGGTRVYIHYLVAASVAGLLYLSGSLSLINLQDMVPFPQPNEKIHSAQKITTLATGLGRKKPFQIKGPDLINSKVLLASIQTPWAEHFSGDSYSITREMPPKLDQAPAFFNGQMNSPAYSELPPKVKLSVLGGVGNASNRFGPSLVVKAAYVYAGKGKFNSLGLSISSLHLFEKEESGKTTLESNLFLNAEWGVSGRKNLDLGMGYMVFSKSDIFKNHTVHFYGRFPIGKLLKVSPEVILTDNFKRVVPGISLLIG